MPLYIVFDFRYHYIRIWDVLTSFKGCIIVKLCHFLNLPDCYTGYPVSHEDMLVLLPHSKNILGSRPSKGSAFLCRVCISPYACVVSLQVLQIPTIA